MKIYQNTKIFRKCYHLIFFYKILRFFVYKEQDVSLPFLNYCLKYLPTMQEYQKNTVRVIAILFMLSTAPLAVTYSYAESGKNFELEKTQDDLKSIDESQKEKLRTFFSEKLVNGKAEVKNFSFEEISTNDGKERFSPLEETSGLPYTEYKGYQSGIVIFDGNSPKDGVKYLKISVNGSLNLSKGELNLEVIGKSINSNLDISENLPEKDLDYRVIFSGNMTESDEKNQFLIVFLSSILESSEKSLDPQLFQIKSPTSESINSIDSNQKVRNPYSV